MKIKKQKTISQLKKDLDKVFKHKVRLRDSDSNGWGECISCGKRVKYGTNEYHAGHYVPVGMGMIHRWTDENCNCQCSGCNLYKNGAIHDARKGIIEKYGSDMEDYIWSTRHEIFKPTREWLENRIEEEKLEIVLLQKSKGLI